MSGKKKGTHKQSPAQRRASLENLAKARQALARRYGYNEPSRRGNPETSAQRSAAARAAWARKKESAGMHERLDNPAGGVLSAVLGMVIGGAVGGAEAAVLNHFQVLPPVWRGVVTGGTGVVLGGILAIWYPVVGAGIGAGGVAAGTTVGLSGPPASAKSSSSSSSSSAGAGAVMHPPGFGAVDYNRMGAVNYDAIGKRLHVDTRTGRAWVQ